VSFNDTGTGYWGASEVLDGGLMTKAARALRRPTKPWQGYLYTKPKPRNIPDTLLMQTRCLLFPLNETEPRAMAILSGTRWIVYASVQGEFRDAGARLKVSEGEVQGEGDMLVDGEVRRLHENLMNFGCAWAQKACRCRGQ